MADSPLSHDNKAKSALAPEEAKLSQERFAVVNTSDLRPVNGTARAATDAGALAQMRELIRDNPALEGDLQVVPEFEVNRS